MPRLCKYHVNKSVLFVTTSIEQGLMLNANPLCKLIITTSLARAQALHPVRVCHFTVEATHIHMLVVVDNPNDIKDFMERFKTEVATRLNKVLGRKKRTIWCKSYDSPVLLTVDAVKHTIAYIYTNPAKDNLEESIDKFPGLSSWKMFRSGNHNKEWSFIRRPAFRAITPDARNITGYEREAKRLETCTKVKHTFTLSPDAWMEVFDINNKEEQKELNDEIVANIRNLEKQYKEDRVKSGKSTIGKEKLAKQLIDTDYLPDRSGRKMWCISTDVELRKELIEHIKDLVAKARDIYARWKIGDYSLSYPLGLYPPAMPKIAEPVLGW